ncbi:MAG: ferredoxin family protein [Anaerolineales bacterium]|nr:ferredoxin family protein [Anaerolineales bacterium]
MTHVITSLCLRDNGCQSVCPVECINPGDVNSDYPTYYIDPGTCIDCGACVPECPFHAIFPVDETPNAYKAKGGEFINAAGLTGHYEATNHHGEKIVIETARALSAGEVVDLTPAIKLNEKFYK